MGFARMGRVILTTAAALAIGLSGTSALARPDDRAHNAGGARHANAAKKKAAKKSKSHRRRHHARQANVKKSSATPSTKRP